MLLKLVNQAEKPGLILIEDSLKVSGTRLFQAFLANQSKDTTVHLFLFENNPKDFLTDLDCDNVIIHDFYTDPLGWNCGKIMLPTFTFSKHLHDLTDQNVVAIDSVGMYLINHSASLLCRDLHKLQMNKTIKQCVVLVHCDEILPEVKILLQYLSNVFLSLTNEEMEVDKSKRKTALVRKWRENILICKTTFKKFNGKLIFSDEEIKISSNLNISALKWALPNADNHPDTILSSNEPSVVSDLTFNLSLSNKEKRDRERLVMPYTQAKLGVKIEDTRGDIVYEADEVDDYDEEDPDDDLDF